MAEAAGTMKATVMDHPFQSNANHTQQYMSYKILTMLSTNTLNSRIMYARFIQTAH